MIYLEYVEELILLIKSSLPPEHALQGHELFPDFQWTGRPIFIVEDDTTGEYLLMNFAHTNRKRNKKDRGPRITVLKNQEEVMAMIERDHVVECARANHDSLASKVL